MRLHMTFLVTCLTLCLSLPASSHPGKRDKKGCHTCRTNCEKYGLKEGQYHCHGDKREVEFTPVGVSQAAYVEKVTDGDTLKVRLLPSGQRVKIRLLGIDCPESHHNSKCRRDEQAGRPSCDVQVPWGKKASKEAAKLLKHRKVHLECGRTCKQDRYKRWLRYVRLEDGRDFGFELVRRGLCIDFGFKYPHPRGKSYTQVQSIAKSAKRGFWVVPDLNL